jgi:1-deoxy-D-xylulose-5-phosphate reductoisomerase
MNKGLEIIEASRLFGIDGDRLKIAVHPQSIAHGFVVFTDGSIKGQLCAPDMRIPIGYALAYPHRLPCHPEVLAVGKPRRTANPVAAWGTLDFQEPDSDRFPCVRLAYEALRAGGTSPAVLSAANEVAVSAFVEGRIGFLRIAEVIEYVLGVVAHRESTLEAIRTADREARIAATNHIKDASCSVSSPS